MSIDRFILKKLDNCREEHTRANLLELFRIRIEKAQKLERGGKKVIAEEYYKQVASYMYHVLKPLIRRGCLVTLSYLL